MNKRILGLALPNIITNITVPLLGMVDMAIVGHLSGAHIGAIAIGSSIFNLIYWNFGFLRMGTSGLTAQAYGAANRNEMVRLLVRALSVAWAIALLLILLQTPISSLSRHIFGGSPDVLDMAITYFLVRIWASPATLGNYAIKGWLIGMQNSRTPMWISIILNVINIICSLIFVLVLHWDIVGVALGTVIAQYSGLVIGLVFIAIRYRRLFRMYGIENRHFIPKNIAWHHILSDAIRWKQMKYFFRINVDIFLRTICLSLVFTFITAASGYISDEVLAIDALLMQFFTLFSYIMDGFAYAGESLVGRYIGARDSYRLHKSVRLLTMWGILLTIFFTILYALFGDSFLRIFSNDDIIISASHQYLFWTLIIPVCGFSAFLFDGIFIGATASKVMRNSMFAATLAFFALYFGVRLILSNDATIISDRAQNNILFSAFMLFLVMRGVLQALSLQKAVYAQVDSNATITTSMSKAE